SAQQVQLGRAEVVPYGTDHVDLVEEGPGQGKVDGGAAEHPLAAAEWSRDRVERDRSHHGQRHARTIHTPGPRPIREGRPPRPWPAARAGTRRPSSCTGPR